MTKNYFKGKDPADEAEFFSSYGWRLRARWATSIFVFFGSLELIALIIFLPIGALTEWSRSVLFTSTCIACPLWIALLYTVLFERIFGQTAEDKIHVLKNPYRVLEETTAPTGENEIEPLPGHLAIPPRTIYAKFPWEGFEEIDITTEVLISSKDLDKETRTLYSLDKKVLIIEWQVNVAPLLNSMKYVVNQLRFGKTVEERHKFFKAQILNFVAGEVRTWVEIKNYDEKDGKKREITLEEFQAFFKKLFNGEGLHELEMKLGVWTGSPKGISCTLSKENEEALTTQGLIDKAVEIAEKSMKSAGPSADYAQILAMTYASFGIPVPEGLKFLNFRVTGDPQMAAVLAKQIELETLSGERKVKGK